MLVLMGGFGFATVPGLQMRIMTYAGSAPTLASGSNIAAFNVGNALGAWLGGLTITAGLGYTSPLWVGAVLSAGCPGRAAGRRPGGAAHGSRPGRPRAGGRRLTDRPCGVAAVRVRRPAAPAGPWPRHPG